MSASNIAQYGPAMTWVASRTTMPSSNVDFVINESIAVVTLNRPEARNAFTWDMYLALFDILDAVGADENVRVLIIRGSDGAFSAGTDISHFRNFVDADSGVVYEHRLEQMVDRLERLPVATIAEVDGVAAGGGCAIAMACDFRVCSDRAKFGVPVARTLGNCLSIGQHGSARRPRRSRAGARHAADGPDDGCEGGGGHRSGDDGRAAGGVAAGGLAPGGRTVDARTQHDRGDEGDHAAAARSPPPADGSRRRHHPRVLWIGRVPGGRRRVPQGRRPSW